MTTCIQVYTTVDSENDICLVATDGIHGWYIIDGDKFPSTWSTKLMPVLVDSITIIRSGEAWEIDREELKDLVYEVDIKSHPEFFI